MVLKVELFQGKMHLKKKCMHEANFQIRIRTEDNDIISAHAPQKNTLDLFQCNNVRLQHVFIEKFSQHYFKGEWVNFQGKQL